MAKKPPLKLVGSSADNPGAPPATLGKAGRHQWEVIQSEYAISDSGGLALLEQICAAVDEIDDPPSPETVRDFTAVNVVDGARPQAPDCSISMKSSITELLFSA